MSCHVPSALVELQGTHLTLTCVICHGHLCKMFLAWEGMPLGTNWTWECEPCIKLRDELFQSQNIESCRSDLDSPLNHSDHALTGPHFPDLQIESSTHAI